MDEYVGGTSTDYLTNEPMLLRGLELLTMLKEDLSNIGADSLHQLQRAWELNHRVLASECVTQHTLYRKETRWPGYYYSCLLYTSPSPRDISGSRMPSSA